MGNLFDLIAGINQPAPARPGLRLVDNTARQKPAEPPHTATAAPAAPTPAPAAEAASEPRRNAWTVTRNGKPVGYIVGQPMTRSEALADVCARGWPDADILEN